MPHGDSVKKMPAKTAVVKQQTAALPSSSVRDEVSFFSSTKPVGWASDVSVVPKGVIPMTGLCCFIKGVLQAHFP